MIDHPAIFGWEMSNIRLTQSWKNWKYRPAPRYHGEAMSESVTRKKLAVAAEAWGLMADFAFTKFQSRGHVTMLRRLGLTPGHLKALSILDPDQPKSMRSMADALACDASQVTWLVDRLEERGLVERRTSATDRRVKTLALTPSGIDTRRQIAEALYTPPEDLLTLDLASLEALRDELRKLPAPERRLWSGSAASADKPATA
jgi:DNA-binding MarR family transcriptional regulator